MNGQPLARDRANAQEFSRALAAFLKAHVPQVLTREASATRICTLLYSAATLYQQTAREAFDLERINEMVKAALDAWKGVPRP